MKGVRIPLFSSMKVLFFAKRNKYASPISVVSLKAVMHTNVEK